MKKSHLILGVLAVAVVVGIAASRSPGTLAPDDSAAAAAKAVAQSALVVYTNEGFVPKTLKVTRGTTIRFFNASAGGALRIAPRVAATDTTSGNRELTASKSVKLGESFYVSVTAPGTWGYENLNKPSAAGVVIVE